MWTRGARSRVTDLDRITGLDVGAGDEIALGEHVDRPGPNVRRDVARFERPQHLMDEHTIADFDRNLGEILVAAVHRIARLKCCDSTPAPLGEERAGLGRSVVESLVLVRVRSLAQGRYAAGQIDLALSHDLGHARMLGVDRAKHVLTLE